MTYRQRLFFITCLSFFVLMAATAAEGSSSVTVLTNDGTAASGVRIMAYGSSNNYLDYALTNSSGIAVFNTTKVPDGIQAKFRISNLSNYPFFTYDSGLVMTPPSPPLTANIPMPTPVTVLNGGTGVQGVNVYAYDAANTSYGAGVTNTSGLINCYINAGVPVKFVIQYGGFICGESAFVDTPFPSGVTLDLPQPSSMTVLNGSIPQAGKRVDVYDDANKSLGYGTTNAQGMITCYLAEGKLVKFKMQDPPYESSLITTPVDHTINFALPSAITILDAVAGVAGIEVSAYASLGGAFITSGLTDSSGIATLYINSGAQFTYSFSCKGYSHTSGIMTAPFAGTVNLPVPSVITVLNDGSGVAYFYFEGGKDVVFEAQYDSARYFSEWITAPAGGSIDISSPVRPASICAVTAEGSVLMVNGSPYKIKGVGYQPIPIGEVPWASNWANDTGILNRDFPILVDINVNTIRTWNRVTSTLMNSAAQYGIKVIAGYWIDPAADYADPAQRASIKADFKSYVSQFKNKPALLFWAIGNAQNRNVPLNKLPYWYSLVNEMAYEAFMEERLFYHPVAVVNDSLGFVGDPAAGSDDASMKYLDIWGTEVLTGSSFGGYFNAYSLLSDKPLWIAAYGVDAYDNNTSAEDEATQAAWISQSTTEIINSVVTIGGTLNEYTDEWWLAGNEWGHDTGGWPSAPDALPDDYANTEWWGIASVTDNGTEPDIITLRQTAYSLKDIFASTEEHVSRVGSGQQYATIEDALADPAHEDIIYVYPGTYNVGMLEIGDAIILIGQQSPQPVIKGNLVFLDTEAAVENFTIHYSAGENAVYTSSDGNYVGWNILCDAGITAVNSEMTVKNCVIEPDPDVFGQDKYGKGIQIWCLYGNPGIAPLIEDCQISNADTGIYLFSQAFGGAILGEIKNNTLDSNNYGIVLRMHKEKPIIRENEITNSINGIHITYEDGTLLAERLANISDNTFSGNTDDIWCDKLGQ